jgi:hypothetical protein
VSRRRQPADYGRSSAGATPTNCFVASATGAARLLSRRWVVKLAVTVSIGAVLLYSPTSHGHRRQGTIMDQLTADLRARCSAKDTSATCRLRNGTLVSHNLFEADTEVHADVVNGSEPAPNGRTTLRRTGKASDPTGRNSPGCTELGGLPLKGSRLSRCSNRTVRD